MTGGSATQAGIGFQNKVAAFLGVYILADARAEFLGLPGTAVPTRIELETSAPVDDILVSTSDAGLCFINVKKSVTISKRQNSHLGSVVDQFVRLWITCASGRLGRSWQRPLVPDRDRLVLVTGGQRSARFAAAASVILGRVADLGSIVPRESIAKTEPEQQAYDTLLELLRAASRRHTGNEFSDEVLATLLSMTRVVQLDPDGVNKATLLGLLKSTVVADAADADAAWAELIAECQRLAEHRSGADRAALRNTLRARGIRLAGAPEIAADVRRLERVTEATLASLAHLAHLDVPTPTRTQRIVIDRDVTNALVEHAPSTSLLIIGEPGSGKSGAVFSAATRLIADGHPVVVIAVERHPVHSLDDLRQSLRLDRDLLDVLRNWSSDQQGVLFIDALDASRGGSSEPVFRELIRRVIEEAPNWHVSASIRVFDLTFGVHYRRLFQGQPVDKSYEASEFTRVQHILIPQLSDQELAQVWSVSAPLRSAYDQGTSALRDLLRSPFNLFLLANVLALGLTDVREITTQLELLHRYWSYRVTGSDHHWAARETLLKRALDQMLEERTLQAAVHDGLDSGPNLAYLLSAGVLTAAEGAGDRISRISFAHHVLFDYAVARLVLEGGRARDFAGRLTSSDDRALLIAPSAMMAFQILWGEDTARRSVFWKKAFEVASAAGTGAFCRMLPARTAAALAESVEDFEPVLNCLRRPDCEDRAAAVFLTRHSTGALSAGVAPKPTEASLRGGWPRIVRTLAETAVQDVGWMLKPLIGQWVEEPAALTADERRDVGVTARLMLRYGITEPYDSSMVIVGIQGVARTFESAPTESVQSLGQLLSPEHVAIHGHEELSWVSREIEYLLAHVPTSSGLIRDTYKAGYCTPLPSRDERTSLGRSRILSLSSNRRQDFEHAQWELFERFPSVFAADPQSATETLIAIVECHAVREHTTDEIIAPIAFPGVTAAYQADHSYAWLRRGDDHHGPPVHAFESGLLALIDGGRLDAVGQVLDVVIRRNRLASVWAAILRAGASRPDVLGRRLFPLLIAPVVLEGRDTRKASGDLLRVAHPLLSEEERVEVEHAILGTNEYAEAVLLACLDERHIVSSETRERRLELEKERPLPPNRNPFEITTEWGAPDDDWWLKREGVDLSAQANSSLNAAIKALEELKRPGGEDSQKVEFLAERWNAVQSLHAMLQSQVNIPEALRMSAWNAIAEAAGSAAAASNTPEELTRFAGIEDLVAAALNPVLWPEVSDPEREESFAKMPSWSSPAPRVEAAGALMALLRAHREPWPQFAELTERLARDPSPAVRHQILGRANMLLEADRSLMWKLCEIGFDEERNEGVLSFFLPAIVYATREKPEWFERQLLALDERIGEPLVDHRRELVGHIVQFMLRLWFVHDQPAAGDRVCLWAQDPIGHAERVQHVLSALRDAMVQGEPSRPDAMDDRVRTRTIGFIETVVMTVAPVFRGLWERSSLTEVEKSRAETALRILDRVATEIYFGSGAYGARNRQAGDETPGTRTAEVRLRFLQEMSASLKALAEVPYPSVTHHLLETLEVFIPDDPPGIFRLVTEVLVSGGQIGGYQLESLGSTLFVKIVRRYLADYRAVIVSDEQLRHRLMQALDVFVDAGWPEARRLVYELPEMLR